MYYFFMVIKLLVLKILLNDLFAVTTAARYDYGYHPSAEEYDHRLSQTRRYWTHTFLKAERDKLLTKPEELENRATYESRYFVPKFQYENNEAKKFTKHNSPKMHPAQPLKDIGSTLEFNYHSEELPKPLIASSSNIQPNLAFDCKESTSKPVQFNTTTILVKPLVKPLVLKSQENAFKFVKRNHSQESLPIYFTNPATGIVYAITELGKSPENFTKSNGTIPIFVTKEQHERDILQLKKIYEQKCKNLRVLTTPTTPIIRAQKPLANVLPITSTQFNPGFTNLPRPLKKPAPVVIKTELIVKDKKPAAPRPVRKRKNKPKPKPKRKIKKQKPPGHKMVVNTTIRPLLANQPEGPAIILGTRTLGLNPYKNHDEHMPTQLEKPNFENIFSGVTHQVPEIPVIKTGTNQHRLSKRSIAKDKQFGSLESPNPQTITDNSNENSKNGAKTLNSRINFLNKFFQELEKLNLKIMGIETQNSLQNNRDLKLSKNVFKNRKLHMKINNLQNPEFFEFESTKNNLKAMDNKYKTEHSKTSNILTKNYLKNGENKPLSEVSNINSHKKSTFQYKRKLLKSTVWNNTNFFNLKRQSLKQNFAKKLNTNKALETSQSLHKNITSLKTNATKTQPQNSGNNLNSITFLNKTNKKSSLNTNKELEKQTFPKKYFKNPPLKESNFKYFKHHINKRSTAAVTKGNATLPNFKKVSNRTLDISNSLQNLTKRNVHQTQPIGNATSTNSTESTKVSATKLQHQEKKMTKRLKKRKRLAKIRRNPTNQSEKLAGSHKRILKKNKTNQKKPQSNQDTEYYLFDIEESYEEEEDDDGDDDEEDDSQEEEYADDDDDDEEAVDEEDTLATYGDEPFHQPTSEAGLSMEEINIKTSQKKDQESNPSEVIEENVVQPPLLDYDNDKDIDSKTQITFIKKRFRRRPPQPNVNQDYDYDNDDDDDEEDNSITSNLGGFFRMIFYPIQILMSSVMDSLAGKDNSEEDDSPYTQYTSYHNNLKQQQQSSEDYDDDNDEYDEANESSSSSLSSWFSSWFAFNRRNKKIGSTTVAPIKVKPTKASSSWLPSWLTFGASDDEYDKWFASWFGQMKPKARRRTTTTTTSTTTQIPHVPILTIVDPMKNPQNWIGILAHHIINHTSTSTVNPLKDIWNKVTTTTTENPEIPRKITYDKYQIWRLKPQDESQVKALEEYKRSEDGIKLQWLKGPSLRGLTDVLVPPKMLIDFQASLTFELIDHEVLIFDVGKAISYEKTKEDFFFTTTQKPKKHQGNKHPTSMTWHKYYEYDDIIKYLETMRMRFPHLVELIHIGRSYEGRPLIVTKIESREAAAVNSAHYNAHQRNKLRHKKRIGLANAVFIEAGTHGMEWIGPATATWIINELLRIMKKNTSDDQSFIRNTTWYVMPVLNPDGYIFSHEFDRFWKKSRSRHISRPSGIINSAMTWLQTKRAKEKVCFGVDLDRNWHYQWGRRGSSKSACNEFYAGPAPFSEPETKALSEFLMDYRTQIKLFVSMQSYGQIISYPYKANTTYDSERLDELLDVAMVGTDNLRKRGSKSRYKIDSSNDLVEHRSGCSDAFAAYEVGIPFSYTLQLADNGVHGYLLPSASIESTARDSFDIITGMLDYI